MLSINQTETEDFMNKAKRYVGGFAVLAGLFAIGSLMRSPESQAKGAYSSPVTVLNTSSAPALASVIDDPGRIAYQAVQQVVPSSDTTFLEFSFGAVPANHRLVVQHVSGILGVAQNSPAAVVGLAVPGNGGGTPSNFFTPSAGGVNAFDQPVLVYFDPGRTPTVFISGPTFLANHGDVINLTGYMLDCSAAPCAPIAQ
jgi:hypothetical protein